MSFSVSCPLFTIPYFANNKKAIGAVSSASVQGDGFPKHALLADGALADAVVGEHAVRAGAVSGANRGVVLPAATHVRRARVWIIEDKH